MSQFERRAIDLLERTVGFSRDMVERMNAVERQIGDLKKAVISLGPRVGDIESREAAEEIEDEIHSERETPGDPSLIGRTVLVAEDEPALQRALVTYLERHGAEVVICSSASEGRTKTTHREDLFAAVIDYHLRCIERGIGLARWLRERWPRCRIMLTSGDEAGLEMEAEAIGQVGAVVAVKPDILEPMKEMLDAGRRGT